jgi:hypothetical protein
LDLREREREREREKGNNKRMKTFSQWGVNTLYTLKQMLELIPVTVRSKALVCGRSLTRIVVSNPTGGMDVCVVFVVRTVAWNVK